MRLSQFKRHQNRLRRRRWRRIVDVLKFMWNSLSRVRYVDESGMGHHRFVQKVRIQKFLLTRAYEKDHWHSTFLIEKIQVFLSTMAPEGNF